METIAIVFAIIIGCYLISKSIKDITPKPKSELGENVVVDPKQREVEIVSRIASNLIPGVLANPTYWEKEQSNYDALFLAKSDEQIERAEEKAAKFSIFSDEGRQVYINLAWKIYNSIKNDL
jgi:hypothetical protein